MQLIAVLTEQNHYAALERARQISVTKSLPTDRANALLSADASQWLGEIWDHVEIALDRALKRGMEAARPVLEQVGELVDKVVALGAAWVDDVLTTVRERLALYQREAIQQALNGVQQSVSIGERTFEIDRVVVAQSVKVSASVKASLTEVCEFVGEGQIEMSAEYAVSRVPDRP